LSRTRYGRFSATIMERSLFSGISDRSVREPRIGFQAMSPCFHDLDKICGSAIRISRGPSAHGRTAFAGKTLSDRDLLKVEWPWPGSPALHRFWAEVQYELRCGYSLAGCSCLPAFLLRHQSRWTTGVHAGNLRRSIRRINRLVIVRRACLVQFGSIDAQAANTKESYAELEVPTELRCFGRQRSEQLFEGLMTVRHSEENRST